MAKHYDILHVHAWVFILEPLRKAFPDKIIIMHFHGSDLRLGDPGVIKQQTQHADLVTVSTPDMETVNYPWVPNPIDREIFHPSTSSSSSSSSTDDNILCITWLKGDTEEVIQHELDRYGIKGRLVCHNRLRHPILHKDMPAFLASHTCYFDCKGVGEFQMKGFSMLGLQCLSMGIPVILNGVTFSEFPK